MPETAADHPAPATTQHDVKTTLKHLAWGAVPAAIAFIAVLWQILNPYVSHNHQGLLVGVAVYFGNITLASWLWCTAQTVRRQVAETVKVVSRQFAERDRRADQRIDRLQQEVYVINETLADRHTELLNLIEKLCRSVRGLHAHNSQDDEKLNQIVEEIEHLRNLTLGADAPKLPGQLRGPRGI
jgi:hypothetical protein